MPVQKTLRKVIKSALTQIGALYPNRIYGGLWQRSGRVRHLLAPTEAELQQRLAAPGQVPNPVPLVPNPLYFFHIPKTAGSSLKFWLADLFAPRNTVELYTLAALEQNLPDRLAHYRYYTSHLGAALYKFLGDDALVDTFTWLRQPSRRDLSQYHYIRETHSGQMAMAPGPELRHYMESAAKLAIADLWQSDAYQGYYDNLQTRMLSGIVPPQAHGQRLSQPGQNPSQAEGEPPWRASLEGLRTSPPEPLGDLALERAQATLLALPHFGLCEWMQPSVDLFCYRFGLPPKVFDFRLNQSQRSTQESTADDLALVDHHNALDQALYDAATEVFKQRIQQLWQSIAAGANAETTADAAATDSDLCSGQSVDVDQLLQRWDTPAVRAMLDRHLMANFQRCHRADPRYRQYLLSFGEEVFALGWYPRQYSDAHGTWLRWAGPGPAATVLLPLAAGSTYRVVLEVVQVASPEVLSSLQFMVNGVDLPFQRASDGQGEGPYFYSGFLPARLVQADRPYTPLTLVASGGRVLSFAESLGVGSNYATLALGRLLAEAIASG